MGIVTEEKDMQNRITIDFLESTWQPPERASVCVTQGVVRVGGAAYSGMWQQIWDGGKKKKDIGRTMEKKGQEYYKVENDTV